MLSITVVYYVNGRYSHESHHSNMRQAKQTFNDYCRHRRGNLVRVQIFKNGNFKFTDQCWLPIHM